MRRLSRRGRRERGAVAVVVAIWMVVALGFAAISIDVGSIYSDKTQLQNGADAAALAIAGSCVRGNCVDSADFYAKANKLATGSVATGNVVYPDSNFSNGVAVVQTDSVHQNWFAGILGMSTTPISARATVHWGYPSGGPVFPLAFSWCAFKNAAGGWDSLGAPTLDQTTVIHIVEQSCTPPAHNEVPGGFGELKGTNCSTTVLAGGWILSDPGNNGPNSCGSFDWNTIIGHEVMIPLFQAYTGSGTNAQYQIAGLAAFVIQGICLGPQAQAPAGMTNCPSDKRIEGHFVKYVDYSSNYNVDPNATPFGAQSVKLTA